MFHDAFKEVDYINETSQRFELVAAKPQIATKQADTKSSFTRATGKPSNGRQTGFCIRTGVEIPFNVEKPMNYDAFKSWSKYGDTEYAEKFCHFSGEPSNGETSVSRPILKKNWKKAKELHEL